MDGNYVSMDSPLGRSLMGKGIDDEVTVELPGGAATFTVAAVNGSGTSGYSAASNTVYPR